MQYNKTETRLQLLKNGFIPLPNKHKMCLLKEWSSIEVTEKLIHSKDWTRARKYRDTGVRCGDVVALDLDIEDENLLRDFINAYFEENIVERSNFIRIGKPPKVMWIYRSDEKIGKSITGKFGNEGDTEGPQIEVLGYGCQFGAYGQHSDDFAYSWPAQNLLDHHISELPLITRDQARATIEFAIQFFESKNLQRITRGGDALDGFKIIRDLEKDHVYKTDVGEMSVVELEEYLKSKPKDFSLRLRSSPFRPNETNLKSVLASITHDELCISDFYLGTTQFRSNNDMLKNIDEIADYLRPMMVKREKVVVVEHQADQAILPDIEVDDEWEMKVKKAENRYVFIKSSNSIGDLNRLGEPDWNCSIDSFKTDLDIHYKSTSHKSKEQTEWLFYTWRRSPNRKTIHNSTMRPDIKDRFFRDERNTQYVNSYIRPKFPVSDGSADEMIKFLHHLFPIDFERDWFITFMAAKYKNPAMRGPGIVMVADRTYGCGRNTLFDIFGTLLGKNWYLELDYEMLTGKNNQAHYIEWNTENVLICVDEAHENRPGKNTFDQGKQAYEKLKSVIDPGKEIQYTPRKTVKNTRDRVFSSIMVATNHADAFIIPANDRRIVVLTNGEPLSEEDADKIHAWKKVPANLGAFAQFLLEWDTSDFNSYRHAIWTEGKNVMVERSISELDEAFEEVFASWPADIVVFPQVKVALDQLVRSSDFHLPNDWEKAVWGLFKKRTSALTADANDPNGNRFTYDKKTYRLRVLRNKQKWLKADRRARLREFLKGGDPEGDVQKVKETLGDILNAGKPSHPEENHQRFED